MPPPEARANWLEYAARRKNGLNFQIFLSGTLVCLSSIPLVLAFAFPVLSFNAFAWFSLGFVMAYGAWPVFCAGVEARTRLLDEAAMRGIGYDELDRRARGHVPGFAQRVVPRLS